MSAKNKVVSLNYCLKDTQGEELDRADADKPMKYIHGGGTIVSGLENALDGLREGYDKSLPNNHIKNPSEEGKKQDCKNNGEAFLSKFVG